MTDPRRETEGELPDDEHALSDILRRGRDDDALEANLAMRRARAAMFERPSSEPQLGDYILLEPIGRGGAGVVYLAFDPDLDRQVAIKLLHDPDTEGDGSTGTEQARLKREAHALAKLSHPNVITIYDAGSYDREDFQCAASGTWDPRGEPPPMVEPATPNRGSFIVMEYVAGETLAAWQARPHAWSEVLSVYVDAARGLAAAHQAGLVHRDFKPSNVLIGKDGRARVLDFGLVHASYGLETTEERDTGPMAIDDRPASEDTLLARDDGAATPLDLRLTEAGAVMGTPAYMAPEQHRGRATDARTDQYSFCASLFEALYGRRAFEGKTLRALREAKEAGPPPNPGGIPRPIYDAIARGLSPRSRDRFGSMEELIAILSRDFGARRRRWLRVGLGAVAVGLLAAAIPLLGEAEGQSCESVADLAGVWDAARSTALREHFSATGSAYADDVAERSARMLDVYAESWRTRRVEVCARDEDPAGDRLREREIICLEQHRSELAALVDALMEVEPGSVRHAIQAVEGLPAPERCSDTEYLEATIEPPSDPQIAAQVASVRERIERARARHRLGDPSGGVELAREAVAQAENVDYPPVQAEALVRLGDLQGRVGEAEAAGENLERAYWLAAGGKHPQVAFESARLMVITLGLLQSRPEPAMRWADHARLALRDLGEAPSARAYLLDATAHVSAQRGDHEGALAQYQQALEIVRALDEDDSLRVADLAGSIGGEYWALGRLDEAYEQLAFALKVREHHLGPEHPNVAKALTNIGVVLGDLGRRDEALAHQKRSLDILARTVGAEHPDNMTAHLNLGVLYREMERHAEADEQYEHALALVERRMGPEHRMAGYLHFNLGNGALIRNEADAAKLHMTRAVEIGEKAMGGDPKYGAFVCGLGKVLHERGEPGAIAELERGLAMLGDGDSPAIASARAEAQFTLARALWAQPSGRSRALELARAARETDERLGESMAKELAEVDAWLAEHGN